MMVVTDIKVNQKNKKRVSVFLDDEFAFSCYVETMEDERIALNSVLEPEDVERIRKADSAQYAWQIATRYLARGLKSEYQVRNKLRERGADPDLIESTMGRLREYRLVDDEDFARLYAEELYGRYGRWGVVRKLREKGISQDIIDAVADSPGDGDVLFREVERLEKRYRNDERARRSEKIIRSLAGRGFEFDDVRRAIRDWEESEADAADEDVRRK